ncbi:hypothetical protein [Streptomyces noursei]|uniref:hypothetical protein n=1 Tax=Streptomyces noursei TaxID=1971 RepID=UPI0023B7B8C2|nr:hypothetical protein [Streptomyces noursei]
MVLLAAAYALVEEGPIDQMLWNPHYGGVDMGLVYADTQVPWLGTSAALLQDVLSMHSVWSICVPIALVEAFGADRPRPWLGRPGLALTGAVFVAGPVAGPHCGDRVSGPCTAPRRMRPVSNPLTATSPSVR